MRLHSVLRSAVLPLVPVCEPGVYEGDQPEYCTFLVTDLPDLFAEGRPHAMCYLVYLHWFLPSGVNPLAKKRQLCRALLAAGFTYPNVEDASDEEGQHFVFECQYADGDV